MTSKKDCRVDGLKMHIPRSITAKTVGVSIISRGEALEAALCSRHRNLQIGKKKPIQHDPPATTPVFIM